MKFFNMLSGRLALLIIGSQLLILLIALYFKVLSPQIDYKILQQKSIELDHVNFPELIRTINQNPEQEIKLVANRENIDIIFYKDTVTYKNNNNLPGRDELFKYSIDNGMKMGPPHRGPRRQRGDNNFRRPGPSREDRPRRMLFRPRGFGIYQGRAFRVFESPDKNMIAFIARETQTNTFKNIIIFIILLSAVVLISLYLLYSWLSPLKKMSQGMKKMGEGIFDVEFEFPPTEEFIALRAEFEKMAKKVKGMLESRDLMLRSLSHDVRSPLARMKLNLEFMQDNKYKNDMEADIEFIDYLVEQVIRFDRVRKVQDQVDSMLDLSDYLAGLEDRYASVDRKFQFQLENSEVILNYTKEELDIIFHNIIDNAIKYSETDTSIEIHQIGKTVKIKDNGHGIPMSDLPFVFEPFYRSDRARSPKNKGYGLGLSMVRELVEKRGGEIDLISGQTEGTTFIIQFG